jgi:gliding motility-associated-like protein
VSVYDRRGDIVTEFDGLTEYWDGTSKGRICTQSSYVYYVRYIDGHDSSWKTLTGTVTLLR